MNMYKDWENLLRFANDDLNGRGYSLLIVEPEEGFYDCEIRKNGELIEVYARNYFEDELCDLIAGAYYYVCSLAR